MKKTKIVLAFIYNDDMPGTLEEIGISLIASVLRKNGYDVLLFSSHESRINFKRIRQYNPGIIGLTIYTLSKGSINRVSQQLKELLPGSFICLGGTYATSNSKEILQENPVIDFVVRGEGEETFLELVRAIDNSADYSGVKGISYRSGKRVIENDKREAIKNLDQLPFAARDILRDNQMKIALISTSRGCRSRCAFCSSQLFWKKWRGRSITNIVDELEFIIRHYNVRVFNFIDSSFEDPDSNLERVRGLAREIINRGLKLYYFVDVRSDFHKKSNVDIIGLLKESGLYAVCIGIESGNEEDLRLYNKGTGVQDNRKIIQLFRAHHIGVNPGFINFNPYTTGERLKKNIDFLASFGFSIRFKSRLSVYKGTRLYNKLKEENLLPEASETGYIYKDKIITHFSDFLFNYVDELNRKHKLIFNHLDYYTILFSQEIILYRSILEQLGPNSTAEVLTELDKYFNRYNHLREKFDSEFANWIKNLLSILASGWDYHGMVSCTNKLMPEDKLLAVEKEFNDLKRRILLRISRSGYSSILINI